MRWDLFFADLQEWMGQANVLLRSHSILSDEYWTWLIRSIGELGNKYDNHPLVVGILCAVIEYQDKNYKSIIGG
ncbi:hypothetical protein ACWOB3_07780 [Enterococcus songbeiensis]